ncbi:putative chromatin remodeling & transcriptional activation CHROMO-DOMAIN family [Helianthus annuus]|nr:putative chromatin remodeling & transcriptional activation CHROMO-DOMAIN family [Helianthus annuus]KAJ0617994.1 putative chromatin remodeling & transcriptional activation CHROMO-DOMAIN family [Helianthus annuus]KAJ0804687.1 putative chromatin remodeling & transcriptional activation CHROMO-DOMAIN family [Helianthus annuus]KAJ0950888.1 putative chromatin remodeling & transcriptional activation CHROMO-DOMAIN family [Helianthus annuus]
MQNSDAAITDDDDASATISDDGAATMDTDTDVGSKNDAVESLPPFLQGDKVLAYHSRRIYEAKVLEVDPTKERFFVHYQGWNKNWDEWVGMDRLMRHNKENLEKQKALEKEYPLEKSVRAFHLKPKNPNVTRGKKRKRLFKGTASYEKLVDVQIPSPLKKHLVNYCEYVTHMGKLVKLPCFPNVDEILKLYLEQQSNKDGSASVEIISGLRCYFDKALPVMLLYKGERKQYEEATANGISPSKVYGAEHLLRLFGIKLPEILYHANIEEETLADLQNKLQDFLKFLQKKQSLFFVSTYETPMGSCTTSK